VKVGAEGALPHPLAMKAIDTMAKTVMNSVTFFI
jgi:hypothetical protein